MKEPGQLAFNAWWHGRVKPEWKDEPRRERADWARVEAAVRAAVLEEAAKVAENFNKFPPCAPIAAAIRALKTT